MSNDDIKKVLKNSHDVEEELREIYRKALRNYMVYGEATVEVKGDHIDVRIPPIPDRPIVDNIQVNIAPTLPFDLPFPRHLENALEKSMSEIPRQAEPMRRGSKRGGKHK